MSRTRTCRWGTFISQRPKMGMIFDSPCTKRADGRPRAIRETNVGALGRLTQAVRVSFHRNQARHVPCVFSDNRFDVTRERVRENVATVVDLAANSIGRPRERGETERDRKAGGRKKTKKRHTKKIQWRARHKISTHDHVGRQSQWHWQCFYHRAIATWSPPLRLFSAALDSHSLSLSRELGASESSTRLCSVANAGGRGRGARCRPRW